MKILLISPVKDPNRRTNRGLMMPQLALFILQGLTPPEHEVKMTEEENTPVDFGADCDLVGISCMTSNAGRAYHIAGEFRKRGKTVVLGGVHPTILPEEALEHADTVVIGEAEGVWEQLLSDFAKGCLQRTYHQPNPDLSRYIPKNFDALRSKRLFSIIPLMTTRGCPYNCDFCCVSNLFGKRIRHVPVENVVRDIQSSGARNFIFLDDNIIGHPQYAKALFTAIKPLGIRWIGQASISFSSDRELMTMAAESGCHALFIGLESVCEKELETMRKSFNDLSELENALKKIRKLGILVHASMIFGFDNDTRETFLQTVRFLRKNKISTVSFNVLTPYPGTKTFDDMMFAGRLLTRDWKYYDHNTVVFQPKNMSLSELQSGKTLARKKFYSPASVFNRFWWNMHHPLIYLATNLAHMKQVKVEKKALKSLLDAAMQWEAPLA